MGLFDIFNRPSGKAAASPRNSAAPAQPSTTSAQSATRATSSTPRKRPPAARGKKRKQTPTTGTQRAAAAPLSERRNLIAARESTLKDLGGLMFEMYKRNRFREELLLDKCEEILAIEVEIAHVDQRLFQLAPTTQTGQRPIGRCECGVPILPGQNFCGVCGRSFGTLTQSRPCAKCGTGLRTGDAFCPSCGTVAPSDFDDRSDVHGNEYAAIEAAAIATRAADTIAPPAHATHDIPVDDELLPPPLDESAPLSDTTASRASEDALTITGIIPPAPDPERETDSALAPTAPTTIIEIPDLASAPDVAIATAVEAVGPDSDVAPANTPQGAAAPALTGRAARKAAKQRQKARDAEQRERARDAKRTARSHQETRPDAGDSTP